MPAPQQPSISMRLMGTQADPEPTGGLVVGSPSTATVPVSDPAAEIDLAQLVTPEVMDAVAMARQELHANDSGG
jgi:hypothetical protein